MSGPTPEAVTALILRGVESARKRVPDDGLVVHGVDVAPLAREGLDGVERMAPTLGRAGAARASAILALLSVGRVDAAADLYFAHVATFDELIAQGYSDARELHARKEARDQAEREAWNELLRVAGEVGLAALKIALPLLLAAL